MSTTKNTTKKATINTASVKVQFMTSSKDFTETMAKFWVAINEMADKKLIDHIDNRWCLILICHESN